MDLDSGIELFSGKAARALIKIEILVSRPFSVLLDNSLSVSSAENSMSAAPGYSVID
jgi:hypothetical protein